MTTAEEPWRHQVTEVPPVQAHITEYQFPNVVCFGPQLTALIPYWTVA